MSKETIKVVEINTDPAKKSIKDLRKELMELKNQMANLDEDSDAFGELANKAGDLKHQIDEINERVKGSSSDFGDMVGNVAKLSAGLVGAFSAVQGGLQAMGVESEAIGEAIKRMQGLMAVVQGLSSIDGAIDAMNDLRNSITSTTGAAKLLKAALQPKVFLAISAAIAGLTLVFNKLKAKQAEAARIQEEYNKKIAEENRLRSESKVQEYLRNLDTELRIKEAIASVNYGDDELAYKKKMLEEYSAELYRAGLELQNVISIGRNSSSWETIGTTYDIEFNKWKEYYKQVEALVQKTEADIRVLEAKADALAKKTKTPKNDALPNNENLQGEVATIDVKPVVLPLTDEDKEKIQKVIDDALQAAAEERLKKLNDIEGLGNSFFNGLKESTANFADSTLGITTGWIAGLDQFQEAFLNVMSTIKESGEMTWADYAKVSAMALNGVGTMLNALSNEQDASTEEGFEKMKKLQIAATTINMLAGITAALSGLFTTKTGPWDIVLASIQAATIAATGAAQIAKIKNTTPDGANPNTNINAKSVSSMIVPPVQYSQAVQGASTEGAIANQKVYVTESDIVDTIGKVSVQETENTY